MPYEHLTIFIIIMKTHAYEATPLLSVEKNNQNCHSSNQDVE